MIDFTTTIAVDPHHIKELKVVWPTWVENRPTLFNCPMVILYDQAVCLSDLGFVLSSHPDVKLLPVPNCPEMSQKEKMLSSLVFLAPWIVKTPWMLKLDCDVFAREKDGDWCSTNFCLENPVFISSPWGYTKPANSVEILDNWGDKVPQLREYSRLNLPYIPNSKSVRTKGRIISYCFFGRTDWLRWASTLCKRLPIASQDTYHWYVARRHRDFYRTIQMKNFGWEHRKIRI